MTDTLITVDLQFQRLLQRAREGQAAGREAKVDREQQQQVEAAGRVERGVRERITIPGQAMQQGRSRRGVRGGPQNVMRRPKEQPAAGYVPQQLEIAYGYTTFFYPRKSQRIYSGDGSRYQDIAFAEPSATGVLPDVINGTPVPLSGSNTLTDTNSFSIVLPAGGKTLLFLMQKQEVTRSISFRWELKTDRIPNYWEYYETTTFTTGSLSSEFYIVSRSAVRQVAGMPSKASEWMAPIMDRILPTSTDPIRTPYREFQSLSQGISTWLYEYDDKIFSYNAISAAQSGFGIGLGSPAGIRTILGDQPGWSPVWLNFIRTEFSPQFLQGHRIKNLDEESHSPISKENGAIIAQLKIPYLPAIESTDEDIETFPLLLAAWDWGKPALCRQLLLELGFSPSDLSP